MLTPKVEVPESVSYFRPISLCTFPYKILSKVIGNRLKLIMPILVAENQTSFVGGKQIMDNVLVAEEVIHSIRSQKGKKGWIALKIDMEKAYDRLKWEFVHDTLKDAKLLAKIIRVIM